MAETASSELLPEAPRAFHGAQDVDSVERTPLPEENSSEAGGCLSWEEGCPSLSGVSDGPRPRPRPSEDDVKGAITDGLPSTADSTRSGDSEDGRGLQLVATPTSLRCKNNNVAGSVASSGPPDAWDRSLEGELSSMCGGLPLHTVHHFAMMGNYVRSLHENERMVDVLVQIDRCVFAAHRMALACHSQYFENILLLEREQPLPVEIKLTGLSAGAFECFLEFVYTGDVVVEEENVGEVQAAAELLIVPALQQRITAFARTMTVSQALAVLGHAGLQKTSPVYLTAFAIVLANLVDVFHVEGFLQLDVDTVCALLSDDRLYVKSEMDVYQVGKKWITHRESERRRHADKVLSCVRFSLLTQRDLFKCVESAEILRELGREKVLIGNWIATSRSLGRADPLSYPVHHPRLCLRTANFNATQEIPTVMGPASSIAVSERSPSPPPPPPPPPPPSTQSLSATPLQSSVPPDSALTCPPDIVVLGTMVQTVNRAPTGCMSFLRSKPQNDPFMEGFVPGTLYTEVHRYNSQNRIWKKQMTLPTSRQYYGVASVERNIYILGGCDMVRGRRKLVPVASVLCIDVSAQTSNDVPSMATPRMRHAVCALKNSIFAMGGLDIGMKVLDTVERFDTDSETWHPVSSMRNARFAAAATAHDGQVWVAGGRGGFRNNVITDVIGAVECYDPRTDTWTVMNTLRIPRCHANLLSCGGRLYVGGGAVISMVEGDMVLSSVSSLDVLDKAQWRHVTDMAVPRHSAAAVASNGKLYFLGGLSTANDRGLESVECFDTVDNRLVVQSDVPWLMYPCRWLRAVSLQSATEVKQECYSEEDVRSGKNTPAVKFSPSW